MWAAKWFYRVPVGGTHQRWHDPVNAWQRELKNCFLRTVAIFAFRYVASPHSFPFRCEIEAFPMGYDYHPGTEVAKYTLTNVAEEVTFPES
jgi:hypothetical protein